MNNPMIGKVIIELPCLAKVGRCGHIVSLFSFNPEQQVSHNWTVNLN